MKNNFLKIISIIVAFLMILSPAVIAKDAKFTESSIIELDNIDRLQIIDDDLLITGNVEIGGHLNMGQFANFNRLNALQINGEELNIQGEDIQNPKHSFNVDEEGKITAWKINTESASFDNLNVGSGYTHLFELTVQGPTHFWSTTEFDTDVTIGEDLHVDGTIELGPNTHLSANYTHINDLGVELDINVEGNINAEENVDVSERITSQELRVWDLAGNTNSNVCSDQGGYLYRCNETSGNDLWVSGIGQNGREFISPFNNPDIKFLNDVENNDQDVWFDTVVDIEILHVETRAEIEDELVAEYMAGDEESNVCVDEDGLFFRCNGNGFFDTINAIQINGESLNIVAEENLIGFSVDGEGNAQMQDAVIMGTMNVLSDANIMDLNLGHNLVVNNSIDANKGSFDSSLGVSQFFKVENPQGDAWARIDNVEVQGTSDLHIVNADYAITGSYMAGDGGNAFACVNSQGKLFRSEISCDQV